MAKTIIVGGYGPGISSAVAERFGKEGFSVAIASRSAERLAAGVAALAEKGIRAAAFPCDLGNPLEARALVGKAREALGPITVLQWTAYASLAGDLLTADATALHGVIDVAVTGLLAAVQEALPDLRSEKDAAILVANGGLAYFDPKVDTMAVEWNAMGQALANAAKHKAVGMLAQKLKPEGIYVGEVMVLNAVKGTSFDNGSATLEAATVAEKFWQIYTARTETTVQVA